MAQTSSSSSITKMHLAMYPWFAFGHFIPFLNLSNELARRGHTVSFLLPKGAQAKLQSLNHCPNLIRFFPIAVPHVDGLPRGAETASDVPFPLHSLLATAFDQTRDQVEQIIATLRPDFVFFDMAFWVPSLGAKLNFKTISFAVVSAAAVAFGSVPSKKVTKDMTDEEIAEPPPGYPSQKVRFKANEVANARVFVMPFGSELTLHDRITASLKESDGIAMRGCQEIEGPFCDYLRREYAKPVFLTGAILPDTQVNELEEKWTSWLGKFEEGSVVYCAFGSQIRLPKAQFQEMLLGFESSGHPFLVSLSPPEGCETVEEAFPNGFEERVQGRGWVYGGWVPQTGILNHPSVGCFVSHCGFGSMWESLVSDCHIVLVPFLRDQIINARLLTKDLEVGVEVERSGDSRWISKESLISAIESVMNKTSESARTIKTNRANLKSILSQENLQDNYVDAFVRNLQDLKN